MRVCAFRAVLAALAVLVAYTGGPSDIKTATAQQLAVEEIVVTARKRAERLQDIPLAITAFTSADIEDAGFQDLADVAMSTAGMQFFSRRSGFKGGRIDSVINLRGASTGASLDHVQPTSLFVDGIFVLGTASSIGLQDLERIEVIKGPQSAFFGRNTFAGAVNFITKNPSLTDYETKIDMSAATYDKYDVNLLTSVPLVEDKLAIQLNARVYSRGGEWTATDGGRLGDESSEFISLVAYGEPTENLSFKFRAYYQKDDDGPPVTGVLPGDIYDTCSGTSVQRLNMDGTTGTFNPSRYICGQVPDYHSGLVPLSRETTLTPSNLGLDRFGIVFSTGAPIFGPQPNAIKEYLLDELFVKSVPSLDGYGMERDQVRVALNVDYEFGDGYVATFLGGWNDMGMNFLRDYDQTDTQAWYSTDPKFGRDFSLETRVASPQDQRFRWLVGATYYDQDFVTSGTGGLLVLSCFNFFVPPACAGGPGIFTLPATSGNTAEVIAGYAGVDFDITEELTFSAEVRYQIDERTTGEAGFFQVAEFMDWVPRFILSYQPLEDTTIYAQASRGVLPGVTNGLVATCSPNEFLVPYVNPNIGPMPSVASECDQIASQLSDGLQFNTPTQRLDAIELGWKQTLADGRFRFNLTGWMYKWKNRPYGISVTWVRDAEDPAQRDGIPNPFPNSLGVQVNGSVKFKGLEFESGMQITENWDAQFNASWQDNENTDLRSRASIQVNGGFENMNGLRGSRYPEWMANLSTTYNAPLTSNWDWYGRADFSYQGGYFADVDNLMEGPSWLITNLRAGITREDFRLELFVRNLFQERAWQNVFGGAHFAHYSFNFAGFRGANVSPQEKRTIGLRTNITF